MTPFQRSYLPSVEAEDKGRPLDKPGGRFWLVALLVGPIANAALGWGLVVATGNYRAVPVIEPVSIAIEALILFRLCVRAGVPTSRRRVAVVRDGVLLLLFATMVAAALGWLLLLYLNPEQ